MLKKLESWGMALLAFTVGVIALVGLFLFLWHVEDATPWAKMDAAAWGTWVGGIGTVATLAGTIRLATNDRRIRRREARDLALVTVASLVILLGEIEVVLRVIKQRLQQHIEEMTISPYQGFLDSFRALPSWQSADVAILVCLERHIAVRVAFIGSDLASIKGLFEDAVRTPKTLRTSNGSAEFNRILIPRLGDAEQRLKSVLGDCMELLHSADLIAPLRTTNVDPANADQAQPEVQ